MKKIVFAIFVILLCMLTSCSELGSIFSREKLISKWRCPKYAKEIIDEYNFDPIHSCEQSKVGNENIYYITIQHGRGQDCPAGCFYNKFEALYFNGKIKELQPNEYWIRLNKELNKVNVSRLVGYPCRIETESAHQRLFDYFEDKNNVNIELIDWNNNIWKIYFDNFEVPTYQLLEKYAQLPKTVKCYYEGEILLQTGIISESNLDIYCLDNGQEVSCNS